MTTSGVTLMYGCRRTMCLHRDAESSTLRPFASVHSSIVRWSRLSPDSTIRSSGHVREVDRAEEPLYSRLAVRDPEAQIASRFVADFGTKSERKTLGRDSPT